MILEAWHEELNPELDGPAYTKRNLALVAEWLVSFAPSTLLDAIAGARTSPHNAEPHRRTVKAIFGSEDRIHALAALGRKARLPARPAAKPRPEVPQTPKAPPRAGSGQGKARELSVTDAGVDLADAFKTTSERPKRP